MRSSDERRAPIPHVSLAPFTTLGVGGEARWFASVQSVEALESALRWADAQALPIEVIGGGSSVVIADRGVEGLVLRVAMAGVAFHEAEQGCLVRAGAGEPWEDRKSTRLNSSH